MLIEGVLDLILQLAHPFKEMQSFFRGERKSRGVKRDPVANPGLMCSDPECGRISPVGTQHCLSCGKRLTEFV